MDIPYFVVHYSKNIDRKQRLEKEFKKYEISFVKWVKEYDRENMTEKEHLYKHLKKYSEKPINKGQISLTLKHYYALEQIIKNEIPISVIMEDNVTFTDNIKEKVQDYLKEATDRKLEWDIIFDGDTHYLKYKEGKVTGDKKLYKKTNKITDQCQGSTRCSNFYIITLNAARKYYKAFTPFYNVCDHWSNHLFRKLHFNIWWVEPPIVHRIMNHKRVEESGAN